MTPEHKLKVARRLIQEATISLRKRKNYQVIMTMCECGHTRHDHAATTSINYTGGFCMRPRCNCRWFMQRDRPVPAHKEPTT